jgi:hypothetical protein
MNCQVHLNAAAHGRIFPRRNPFLRVKRFISHKLPCEIKSTRRVPDTTKHVASYSFHPATVWTKGSGLSWRPKIKQYIVLGSGLAYFTFASLDRKENSSHTSPLDVSHAQQTPSEYNFSEISEVSLHRRTAEEVLYTLLPSVISKAFTVPNAIFLWKFSIRIVRAALCAADSFTNFCISTLIKSNPVHRFVAVIVAANLTMKAIKLKINFSPWPSLSVGTTAPDVSHFNRISDDNGSFPLNIPEDSDLPEPGVVDGAVDVGQALNIRPSGGMAAGAAILSSAILITFLLKHTTALSAYRHLGSFLPKAVKDR